MPFRRRDKDQLGDGFLEIRSTVNRVSRPAAFARDRPAEAARLRVESDMSGWPYPPASLRGRRLTSPPLTYGRIERSCQRDRILVPTIGALGLLAASAIASTADEGGNLTDFSSITPVIGSAVGVVNDRGIKGGACRG